MSAGTSIKNVDGVIVVTLADGTELKMSPQTARVFANALLSEAAKAEGISGHIVTMEIRK